MSSNPPMQCANTMGQMVLLAVLALAVPASPAVIRHEIATATPIFSLVFIFPPEKMRELFRAVTRGFRNHLDAFSREASHPRHRDWFGTRRNVSAGPDCVNKNGSGFSIW